MRVRATLVMAFAALAVGALCGASEPAIGVVRNVGTRNPISDINEVFPKNPELIEGSARPLVFNLDEKKESGFEPVRARSGLDKVQQEFLRKMASVEEEKIPPALFVVGGNYNFVGPSIVWVWRRLRWKLGSNVNPAAQLFNDRRASSVVFNVIENIRTFRSEFAFAQGEPVGIDRFPQSHIVNEKMRSKAGFGNISLSFGFFGSLPCFGGAGPGCFEGESHEQHASERNQQFDNANPKHEPCIPRHVFLGLEILIVVLMLVGGIGAGVYCGIRGGEALYVVLGPERNGRLWANVGCWYVLLVLSAGVPVTLFCCALSYGDRCYG